MSRPLRIEYPGAVYHVSSRGNEGRPVFRDDEDRLSFLDGLHRVNRRYRWVCHAYCLMDDHYHLLLETRDGNLGIGMRQLNGVYTQLFNRRHGQSGHVFRGRYQAILIQKDRHLLELCRHAVLHPVRVRKTKGPESYPWSSYAATAGQAEVHPCLTTKWVLAQFGRRQPAAQKEYRKYVSDGIGQDPEDIWKAVRGQALLGEEDFVLGHADYLRKRSHVSEIPRSQRYAHRPSLDVLFGEVPLMDRRGRRKAILKAVEQYGYRQSEIAAHLGLHYSTISRIAKGER